MMNEPTTNSIAVGGSDSGRIDDDDNNEQPDKTPPAECTGRAAEALAAFRRREISLKMMNQFKPDMVAFKELRGTYSPDKQHGQIEGVPVGLKLHGRGEAAILGIHTQILRGIDSIKGEACYAICVAGKYVDDDDHDADGTLVYTGEGGQKKTRYQVEDQTLTVGNAALLQSIDTQLPIRVLRGRTKTGKSPEYFYDGLYKCTGYTYGPSTEGPLVYKFTLVPIENESQKRSIMVESTRPPKTRAPRDRLLDKQHNKSENGGVDEELRRNATKSYDDYVG